jgi:hypothetical protein
VPKRSANCAQEEKTLFYHSETELRGHHMLPQILTVKTSIVLQSDYGLSHVITASLGV